MNLGHNFALPCHLSRTVYYFIQKQHSLLIQRGWLSALKMQAFSDNVPYRSIDCDQFWPLSFLQFHWLIGKSRQGNEFIRTPLSNELVVAVVSPSLRFFYVCSSVFTADNSCLWLQCRDQSYIRWNLGTFCNRLHFHFHSASVSSVEDTAAFPAQCESTGPVGSCESRGALLAFK